MAYTTIPDTDIDVDSPVTDLLVAALRDNPIAIAAGDTGAPRIEDAALDTTATNTGRDWVLARTALAAVGALGTYAFLFDNIGTALAAGSTRAGSDLRYSNAQGAHSTVGPSGTWRLMGRTDTISDAGLTSVWLRIA